MPRRPADHALYRRLLEIEWASASLGVGSCAEEGLLLGPAAVPGPDRQAT